MQRGFMRGPSARDGMHESNRSFVTVQIDGVRATNTNPLRPLTSNGRKFTRISSLASATPAKPEQVFEIASIVRAEDRNRAEFASWNGLSKRQWEFPAIPAKEFRIGLTGFRAPVAKRGSALLRPRAKPRLANACPHAPGRWTEIPRLRDRESNQTSTVRTRHLRPNAAPNHVKTRTRGAISRNRRSGNPGRGNTFTVSSARNGGGGTLAPHSE